ncbi:MULTISPECIES: radical SAM protein [unclassified Nocardioides]|uniref:radical SAM protein n=1 Tax=unclassified Nocardioides TaxID=2615069 RepID=UPI000056F2F1|nr:MULTISPECIES: radical SAM protein [unclassified Nocardioides]ABL80553.1 Radical SAM domain protein [Nocardioides sp. JS614]
MTTFTSAQELKFELLANGVTLSDEARSALRALTNDGKLTPADYASTSGLILRLDRREWVNAPVEDHNPNFVSSSIYVLDLNDDGFFVHGNGKEAQAEFWPLPSYHGGTAPNGIPIGSYVVSHGDRARLSPTIGCAFECTFCDVPYEIAYGGPKSLDIMLHSLRLAVEDPLQPARHLLISGGTPGPSHVAALRETYEQVLKEFGHLGVDIMMVPVDGLFELPRLDALGVNELSINLELWGEKLASTVMRHKFRQGRQHYLDFLELAAAELGGSRVRSMLMVGIEPLADTLAGVTAIAQRGCVPVLSPFRPDPMTPMAAHRPPTAAELREAFLRASEIAAKYEAYLGPTCDPCTHNTLTFALGGKHAHTPNLLTGAA